MVHHNPARGMHKQYLNRANVERRFSPTAVFGSSTTTDPTTTDDPLFPFPTPSNTPDPDPIQTVTRTRSQIIPDPVTTSSSKNVIPTVVTTSSTPTTLSTSTTSTSLSLPLTTSNSLTTSASLVVPSQTVIQTLTSPSLSSHAAAAATSSPAATGASRISTGAIVGGIAAAAVGIGAVFFAAIFFIRKWRRKNEEEVEWNARNFRQSAVLVDDDAASTNSRFNPRPPTMFERKFANTPPSQGYGGTANFGGLAGAGAGAHGGHDDFQSFAPGEVVWSPTSADPMAPMPGYGPSPVGSPVSVSPYDSQLDAYGNLTRQPSDPSGAYLTRAPSAGQAFDPNGAAHYADLSRSSVTPFQAAQYAEITRRLNDPQFGPVHEVDEPLSPAAASPVPYALQPGMKHKSLTGALEDASAQSPFADPLPSPFEGPVSPPAPAHIAPASGSPTLPLPRVFSPIASDFPAGAHAAQPASPPPAVTRNSGEKQLQAPPAPRPGTVYDEADVYGGI